MFFTMVWIMIMFTFCVYGQKIDVGARPVGLGGGFVAIVDDGNTPFWNPAGGASFQYRALSLSFARRLWGIENDNIMEGSLGYVHHMGKRGRYGSLSLFYEQLFTDVYYESALGAGYSNLLWGKLDSPCISFGLNLKLLRYGFNENKFEGTQPGDPILTTSTSRIAPSADAGLLYRNKKLSLALTGKNINQPDLSMSKRNDETGKVPLEMRLGASYLLINSFLFALDIEYSTEKIAGKSNISIHGGIEKWFGSTIGVRAGYNRNEAAIGASYIFNKSKYDLSFDYAFVYPFEYSGLNVTTHKFSVGMKIAPPRIPLEDLELVNGRVDISPYEIFLGNEVTIRARIMNKGEKREHDVPLTLYYRETEGRWRVIMHPDPIELEPGEIKEVTYRWTPEKNGEYTIFLSVNDDGSKIPRLHPKFEEEDLDNNTGAGRFVVYLPTMASIAPKEHRLEVSKMTIYQEEEPIVPIVFFEAGKSSIDNRFNRMSSTVVSRLKANPDIMLYVRG